MMRRYVEQMRASKAELGIERLLLLCKSDLLQFYADAGFTNRGPSDVVHGTQRYLFLS